MLRAARRFVLPLHALIAVGCAGEKPTPAAPVPVPVTAVAKTPEVIAKPEAREEVIVPAPPRDPCGYQPGSAEGSWTPIPPSGVLREVYWHRVRFAERFLWDGRYLTSFSHTALDTVVGARFDPCSNSWTELPVPAQGMWHKTWKVGGRLLVKSESGDYLLDAAALTWTRVALPDWKWLTARGRMLVHIPRDMGGPGGWHFEGVRVFDPIAGREIPVQPAGAPSVRTMFMAVVVADRFLFVWGGRGGPDLNRLADGAVLDMQRGRWRRLPAEHAPSARSPMNRAVVGDKVVVFGGHGQHPAHSLATGAIYDFATDSWHTMSTASAPKGSKPWVVPVGQRVVVYGNDPKRIAYVYDLQTDAWSQYHHTKGRFYNVTSHVRSDHELLMVQRDMAWLGLFDAATGAWTEIDAGPMRGRRWVHTAWTGSRVIAWGGIARTGLAPGCYQAGKRCEEHHELFDDGMIYRF